MSSAPEDNSVLSMHNPKLLCFLLTHSQPMAFGEQRSQWKLIRRQRLFSALTLGYCRYFLLPRRQINVYGKNQVSFICKRNKNNNKIKYKNNNEKSKWIWEVVTLAASVLNWVTENIQNFLKAPGRFMQQHVDLWLLFQCLCGRPVAQQLRIPFHAALSFSWNLLREHHRNTKPSLLQK